MTVTRQMRSGESQSEQTPVLAQGVFLFRRMVLPGAATSLTRRRASATPPSTILLRPATRTILPGPKMEAATRLPTPSTLTISPDAVTALTPQMNTSHVCWRRMTAVFASGGTSGAEWSRISAPPAANRSRTPSSATEREPPKPTDFAPAPSSTRASAASAAVAQ